MMETAWGWIAGRKRRGSHFPSTGRCSLERRGSMPDSVLNKNNAATFIAGALLGAGVALLLAPQSGRKTRRDLSHFANKTRNRMDAAQIELRHSIDNIVGDVAERIEEGLNRGVDWTESKTAELQRALDAGRKFIQGEIEKIQSS
jgi:gas vesicle protein